MPQGLADEIDEPFFQNEGPDDTMNTTVIFEGENTLATTVLPSS